MQEIGDQLCSVGRVDHFGVEHGRVGPPPFVRRDGVGRVLRHGVDAKAARQARHSVAVAHPDRIAAAPRPDAVEQGAVLDDLDVGPAELGRMPALDRAPELVAERLLSVADGEDRHAARDDQFGRARAGRLWNRSRAAGENHRVGLQPLERLARFGERMDFAIDPGLPHPASDELGDLGAEVDDEDEVVMHSVPFGGKRWSAQ